MAAPTGSVVGAATLYLVIPGRAGAAVPSTDRDRVATGCGPVAFQLREFNFDAGGGLGGGRREPQFDVLINGPGGNGRSRLAQEGSGRRGRRVDVRGAVVAVDGHCVGAQRSDGAFVADPLTILVI